MTNLRCYNCFFNLHDLKCVAFPNGIPNEILTGNNDHSKPLKGQDNEIVFKADE